MVKINPSCFEILSRYHFPGNVRELENILERAMAMCEGEVIEPSDLHLPRTTITPAVAVPSTSTNLNGYLQDQEKELILDALEKTKWNRTAAAQLLGVSFRTLRYRLKNWDLIRCCALKVFKG